MASSREELRREQGEISAYRLVIERAETAAARRARLLTAGHPELGIGAGVVSNLIVQDDH